ncbi:MULTISPECIES: hypothetical protein [Trichocoleus]|uniref:Rho termination factor N-terminal domain-containing protein n=1 Tax=Trichocoleus desertorum GB2-A4 TaxID=2933944 RepID=A0ABV0JH47_9CYAN|nr:hypothetical protein [Trichocoleus sp. FACHB-46]MBD1862325.1 hypothetical protein [Trichocoleus sp. FACHB-46]
MPNQLLENDLKSLQSVDVKDLHSLVENGGVNLSHISTERRRQFIAQMQNQETKSQVQVWTPTIVQ